MFAIPSPTPYDLNFRLLGIPVRVNPFFWAVSAVLGWVGRSPLEVLDWIACVFVSILVHEFGHGLTSKSLYRRTPSVVLYYMGGLCYSDKEERDPWKKAMVLIMGPGAGFLLAGLVVTLGISLLGYVELWPFGRIEFRPSPFWFNHWPDWLNRLIQSIYFDLMFINLFWGLFNLLPIYPLDGGQLANVFLTMQDRREGPMRSYILSMVVAGAAALYLYSVDQAINALFIASLAFLNFQLFQASRYQKSSFSRFEEDDDWWRK
jgi:stage IV sporulation protein FB